jgi:hypothetical protein
MRRIMPVIQARLLLTSNTSEAMELSVLVLASSNHLEIRADVVTSTMADSSLL